MSRRSRRPRAIAPWRRGAIATGIAAPLLLALAGGTAASGGPTASPPAQEASGAAQADTAGPRPVPETPTPGTPADDRDARLDALTAEIAGRFRCLVCRGQSVAESSSRLAREMQREIRERLGRGETPEQIEAFFVDRYGEWILLKPPARGVNLLVYILPGVAFAIGLLVWWRVRRGAAGDVHPGTRLDAPDEGLDPDDRAWLDAAVHEGRPAGRAPAPTRGSPPAT